MASDFATAGVNPAAGDGAVGEENEENMLRAHYLRGLEGVFLFYLNKVRTIGLCT